MVKINACLIALLITLGASAEQQKFWSLSAGWAQPGDTEVRSANNQHLYDVEFDAGWVIEGAIGAQISELPIAYELAVAYQQNEMTADNTSEDATIWTVMANGYYLIDCEQSFTPYGLFGVGVLDFDAGDAEETVLAGQVGAGICYPLDDMTCLNFEYRFLFAEDFEDLPGGGDMEFDSQSLQIGYTRMY